MKSFVDSVLGAAVLSIAIALPLAAAEPQYPSHPLRIIVPFAPGGASDVVGRLLAQKLGESMGQTVVVDNRAGAGANIGIGLAAKAQPDGYTLLVASSAFAVNPSLYAKAPYDPFRDFQPITCVGSSPNILAVHPAFPAKSVKELIDLVRTQPGKHNYASTGTGTTPHLSGEMFRLAFKLDLNHIPFNGAGPELQAMVSGQVPVGFASVPSFAPQVKAGQLRGLAVTADQRTAVLPDVPSMGELGITGMAGDTFKACSCRPAYPSPSSRACTKRSCRRWPGPTCASVSPGSGSSRSATRRRSSPPRSKRTSRNGARSFRK